MTSKLDATFTRVFAHLGSHFFVTVIVRSRCRVVCSRIPEPKAKICYRVVSLCIFQTVDGILQAVLCDAVVETTSTHGLGRDADDFFESTCGVHDCERARKTVEEESRSRLMLLKLCRLRELGGNVRQHVVSWILG